MPKEDDDILANLPGGPVGALLATVAVLLTLGVSTLTIISIITGEWTRASNLSAVTSALATVLLVGLTGWYSWETRRMVDQEREQHERRRETERNQVRRALLSELYAMEYFFSVFEGTGRQFESEVAEQLIEIASTRVYDDITLDVGLLTETEIAYVSSYFNLLKSIRRNVNMLVTSVESEHSHFPEDVPNVSRSRIVQLNSAWKETVDLLESTLPEEPPEGRRRLVELDYLEESVDEEPPELTETEEEILQLVVDRGVQSSSRLVAELSVNIEEGDVREHCEQLVEYGLLHQRNGNYLSSADLIEDYGVDGSGFN